MKGYKYTFPEGLDLPQQALLNLIKILVFIFAVILFIGLSFKDGVLHTIILFIAIFLSDETMHTIAWAIRQFGDIISSITYFLS